MQVKALATGFFDGRRIREGTIFSVPEGAKAKWFTPVGGAAEKAAAAPKAGKGKKAEPTTLAELGTEGAQGFNDVVGKADDLA